MIKVTAPLFENWNNPDHPAFLLAMRDANAQAEIVASTSDIKATRTMARAMNAQTSEDYPRWIAVSRNSVYIDPQGRKPARLPVRWEMIEYRPFPIAVIFNGGVQS